MASEQELEVLRAIGRAIEEQGKATRALLMYILLAQIAVGIVIALVASAS